MKNHSMVFDDFFKDPNETKKQINAAPMADEKYKDGVTYPNITRLPADVVAEIATNMKTLVGPAFTPVLSFARYSFKDTNPPHWAHSDREIAQFLALIYMNPDPEAEKSGTVCLRHKERGFEYHPESIEDQKILLEHANEFEAWDMTFACPAKYNRCLILNADLIHAAMGEYGSTREDGRLVISVFFNLVYQ